MHLTHRPWQSTRPWRRTLFHDPRPSWTGRAGRLVATIAVAWTALPAAPAGAVERFTLELEAGPAWQSRNDVEIPNDGTGTRFSLVDVVGKGPWLAGRLTVTWNMAERHGVRLLAAPFSLTETGTLAEPVFFVDRTFAPAVPTAATYRFNSWRLGYRYRFHASPRWRAWVGFTAKVRDAKIELSQSGTSAQKTDVGFVPLLHVSAALDLAPQWSLLIDAEGLAGGPGRALDIDLEVGRTLGPNWLVSAGYRTIEGGADVTEVYTFAWIHSAVISGVYRWGERGATTSFSTNNEAPARTRQR